MSYAPYPADLYLATHASSDEHVYFYRRACSGAERVLELGCGAGRISCALAADGHQVVGLDIRPDLIAGAPDCGARWQIADMRDFHLAGPSGTLRFERVIAPYHALYCLLDEAALLGCLARIRQHLHPEGLLIFDGWAADPFHAQADPDASDEYEAVHAIEVHGRSYDVYERSDWDRQAQRIAAHYRHVPRDGGPPVDATIEQRYLLSEQVPGLLAEAGLSLVALLGGWDDQAFHEESEHLIVVARAANARDY